MGADDRETCICLQNLGGFQSEAGRHAEAEAVLDRVIGIQTRTLGAHHPDTLTSILNLSVLRSRGQPASNGASEELVNLVNALHEYAMDLGRAGDYVGAACYCDRLLPLAKRFQGSEAIFHVHHNAGLIYLFAERKEDAKEALGVAMAGFEGLFGAEHPQTLETAKYYFSLP